MRMTQHFRREEFDCNDGSAVPSRYMGNVYELAAALEVLRYKLGGAAIKINSGYRSPEYNTNIGGATSSQHLKAIAADIVVSGYTPDQVHRAIEQLIDGGHIPEGGLGLYSTFVHYDIRGHKARWNG